MKGKARGWVRPKEKGEKKLLPLDSEGAWPWALPVLAQR